MGGLGTWEIAGKTALVTGAAKRLGGATAMALAEAGAAVVVHYRHSEEEAQALVAELERRGGRAWALAADLTDPAATEELFHTAVAEAGPIDVLVNNASLFEEDRFANFTWDTLETMVRIHAYAPALLIRLFAGQKRDGVAVNFLDTRIEDYDHAHVSYHLSKRMLFTLTRMAAIEYAPRVRVNAVAPGLILPPEGQDESYLEALADTNPLQAYGSEECVVDAVMFLIRSSFVTGEVVHVDGGRHLRGNVYG